MLAKQTRKRKVATVTNNKKKMQKIDEDEEIEIKDEKEKKLEKNREAAQLFRQRQKIYINDLQGKVDQLTDENKDFTIKTEILEQENVSLKDQLTNLREFVSQFMNTAFPTNPVLPSEDNINLLGFDSNLFLQPNFVYTPSVIDNNPNTSSTIGEKSINLLPPQ